MIPQTRTLASLMLALSLLALAGCGGRFGIGPGAGASASATSYLAEIRSEKGLSPLKSDKQLEKAALEQAAYMARSRKMEHTTGYGTDFGSRMADNDIGGPAAENIAHGRFGLQELFQRWKDSPPHNRNMLDSRMNRFGLAYVEDADGSGRRYWALVLAK